MTLKDIVSYLLILISFPACLAVGLLLWPLLLCLVVGFYFLEWEDLPQFLVAAGAGLTLNCIYLMQLGEMGIITK